MSVATCQKAGCTVADTGICLLSHAPVQCPNFRAGIEVEPEEESAARPGEEPIESVPMPTPGGRSFHTGLELGVDDALELSRAQYCHLIGILGAWDAGKTCFLLSLYLMACRAGLPKDYAFAGSLTLKGFEDRARRLRKWSGGPLPTQLADHTILSDTRQAALLHIALQKRGPDARRINLMLTDIPGEWSKTLVDRASSADRFAFLKRADGLMLVVDGPALASASKHIELTRTKHLLERLKTNVGVDPSLPMTLLISKGDAIGMTAPAATDELIRHAQSLGFSPEPVVAAAFSYNQQIQSGKGVFEALERLILAAPPSPVDEQSPTARSGGRRFAAFTRASL